MGVNYGREKLQFDRNLSYLIYTSLFAADKVR